MKNLICIACGYEWEAEEAESYICPECKEEVEELSMHLMEKIRTGGGSIVIPKIK